MINARGPNRLTLIAALATGAAVVFVGGNLIARSKRARRVSGRTPGSGEAALRGLVRGIGARLEEEGVREEADLDQQIAETKREAYERHYQTTSSSTS